MPSGILLGHPLIVLKWHPPTIRRKRIPNKQFFIVKSLLGLHEKLSNLYVKDKFISTWHICQVKLLYYEEEIFALKQIC